MHPRMPAGKRSTDPEDLPSEKTAYAMRDLEQLLDKATGHGQAIGAYAAALLDVPLPWKRMRSVYRLLGLVKRWGAHRVDEACRRALEAEAVDVGLIGRMLERATEAETGGQQAPDARPRGPRRPPRRRSAHERSTRVVHFEHVELPVDELEDDAVRRSAILIRAVPTRSGLLPCAVGASHPDVCQNAASRRRLAERPRDVT